MPSASLFLYLLVATLAEAQYGYGPYGGVATTPAAHSVPTPTSGGTAAADAGDQNSGYGGGYGAAYGGSGISPRSAAIAHAACGALATMLLFPVGVVAARTRAQSKRGTRWWFPIHAGVQALAVILMFAAFGIAWGRFALHPVDTPHRKCAIAFFTLVLVQALGGMFTHFIRPHLTDKRGRGVANYAHMLLGLCTVGVGWAAAWLGLTLEWAYRGHGRPAFGWRVGWGVVVGLWILVYAAGLGFLPHQLRREREERAQREREEGVSHEVKETVGLTDERRNS